MQATIIHRDELPDHIRHYYPADKPFILDRGSGHNWQVFATREDAMLTDDSRAILSEIERDARETAEESHTHWHVTAHIPGCMNDTNDGPYDSIEVAREAAAELAATYYGEETYTEDVGRFQWIASPSEASYRDYGSGYLISVEECDEPACMDESTWF